ncbi:MAG TPA: endolytic transglycosylase MltG [Chromatiales bacterium]|nr:endolytic transglycosylase MltG [Chromatiales bacterium]
MRSFWLKLVLAVILLGNLAAGGAWLLIQRNLDTPLPLQAERAYELTPGANFNQVINELKQAGILDETRTLRWYGRLSGEARKIKAGEYAILPGTTPRQLLAMFVAGKVRQYALTLVEGWNFAQVMEAVNRHPALRHSLPGLDNATIMARLGHPGEHPEGRFLPDTYHFPKGLSDVDFLKRAYRAMQTVLEAEWAGRAPGLPFETPYEALILASIVEKETGLARERRAIAGVFVRRLQKGMRLQTDPTVIYGMGEAYRGNIRKKDLERDTPYNTYRRSGLPPTPIAMPGRDAIHATLHPDDSDNIYFVARGDGSHQFSATLKEHNQAVIKYQLKGRPRPFSSYNPDKAD